MAELPAPVASRSYPRIAVIDGGISDFVSDWLVDRWDMIADVDQDLEHGTFIAGLLIAGGMLNGDEICGEPHGAELVDIAVFPDEKKPNFSSYYPNGVPDFIDEVANAVSQACAQFKTRICCLSLNVEHPAEPDQYGYFASRLDAIAEDSDAIFFVSAGNTSQQEVRAEWPEDETKALAALASARNDGLLMPAESVRSVSVAALNPPGLQGHSFCPGPLFKARARPSCGRETRSLPCWR